MNLICHKITELPTIARQLIHSAQEAKIWLFEGEMGAGKTTLIKAICHELGVKDNVQSPTFSIVNEYRTVNDETIYHFDFYRLKNETEALDIGIEEYLYSGNLCFLEWSEKITNLIPKEHLTISISANEKEERTISIVS